jgi:hypothetical protein
VGQRSDELRPRDVLVAGRPTGEDTQELDEATAEARADIEQTRAEMTSTIDAIQDKLDPEVLSEQAKDTARDVTDYAIREAKDAAREITDHALAEAKEAVREITGQAKVALRENTIGKVETMARNATESADGWRQSVVATVKANPMPAALVGLGLGWMLLNRPSKPPMHPYRGWPAQGDARYGSMGYPARSSTVYGEVDDGAEPMGAGIADRTQEKASHMVGTAQDTASKVVEQVTGAAEGVKEQLHETGAQVVDQVQEQATRAQTFLERQLDENPLIVGAVAVAIGGVLASTMRPTPREDRLLGETRDRVLHAAQEVTETTMQKVGRVVDEVQSAATDEARKQQLVPSSSGGSAD